MGSSRWPCTSHSTIIHPAQQISSISLPHSPWQRGSTHCSPHPSFGAMDIEVICSIHKWLVFSGRCVTVVFLHSHVQFIIHDSLCIIIEIFAHKHQIDCGGGGVAGASRIGGRVDNVLSFANPQRPRQHQHGHVNKHTSARPTSASTTLLKCLFHWIFLCLSLVLVSTEGKGRFALAGHKLPILQRSVAPIVALKWDNIFKFNDSFYSRIKSVRDDVWFLQFRANCTQIAQRRTALAALSQLFTCWI